MLQKTGVAVVILRGYDHQGVRLAHLGGKVGLLNGGDTITPALEEVIDRIARNFDGFFFGRFDIRVPSREDFMAGRNLKIVELNGVTSEATDIYDPKISLWTPTVCCLSNGGSLSRLEISTVRGALELKWRMRSGDGSRGRGKFA